MTSSQSQVQADASGGVHPSLRWRKELLVLQIVRYIVIFVNIVLEMLNLTPPHICLLEEQCVKDFCLVTQMLDNTIDPYVEAVSFWHANVINIPHRIYGQISPAVSVNFPRSSDKSNT